MIERWAPAALGVGVLAGLLVACDDSQEAAITLTALTPGRAYSDRPVSARLHGMRAFRPAFRVDTQSGTTGADPSSFACALVPSSPPGAPPVTGGDVPVAVTGQPAATMLDLTLPANLPEWMFDLVLRDPRGQTSVLRNAFGSRGPDLEAPVITLESPLKGTYVVAETRVPVKITAEDGNGDGHVTSLGWTLIIDNVAVQHHDCPPTHGAGRVVCDDGELLLPAITPLKKEITLIVEALDDVGHKARSENDLLLARAPALTSIAPTAGPSTGMTQIVVRGLSFVRGTRVLIDGVLITPLGGVVESETLIRGFTVAHEPGEWPVVVETGNYSVVGQNFRFVPVPVIRRITPDEGPDTGFTRVTIVGSHFVCESAQPGRGTRFFVGGGLVRISIPITDCDGNNRVIGLMPPYEIPGGGTGAVSLFARDPTSGESELPNAFTYTSIANSLRLSP